MNSSILGRAGSTSGVNNIKRYSVEAQRATAGRPSAKAWKMKFRILAALMAACRFAAAQHPSSAGGSAEHHSDVEITWHILKPVELAAPDLRQLHVPDGFRIQKFAENVGNARILAIGPNGNVYVTRREQGDVLMFHSGADGLADGKPVRVASRSGLHGIAFSEGKVYLASVHEVFKADVHPDGTFGPLEMIIHDLPDAGQHNTRTVQIGPDDMMYISIGSTCNECAEANPENATILRASLDGKTRSIFASGLRDTVSWGWQPATGELWGMDNGMDALGDNVQAEELNHIEKGKRYGWPYLFGDNQPNPHLDPPGGLQKSELAKTNIPMVLGYTAHAAPMQMSFYNASQFPAEYQGDAFVSMRGSWNRKPPSGYEVVRIHFKNGQPVSISPFVTGFVTTQGEFGRLVGNAIAQDGSLLFTDDRNGVIYRVSYAGSGGGRSQTQSISGDSMRHQVRMGVKSALAVQLPETATAATLTVSSDAFAQGAAIPPLYSAYEQNASPPLRWTAGPRGTHSYAILVEDPDAKTTPLPVIHWVVWNIPSAVTALREGLESSDRLEDPMGLRQGPNTAAGSIGYKGPRPPEGDPAHHYHFEVFALDQMLALRAGANREDLVKAMNGHVLAKGEVTGLFRKPERSAKP
jgi:Raf kinase inhibitor-like YbhB/YbcL family protein